MSNHLKIKLKSLAAEVRIIKNQERKYKGPNWGSSYQRSLLQRHRLDVVRPEIRHTHLAYGYLRGRSLDQIESCAKTEPDWERVYAMVKKYGSFQQRERSTFDAWRNAFAIAA
jgi:hypothetical protein